MRTFVVHSSDYMLEDADLKMYKAKDIRDLMEQIGFLDDENTCGHCGGLLTEEGIVKQWHDANGDGQAHYTIREVITELDGIHLTKVPELKEED